MTLPNLRIPLLVAIGMFATLAGRAQTTDTFSGSGGRCNVGGAQASVSYLCSRVPIALNGESVSTHYIAFNVIATNGIFSNGAITITDSLGDIVLTASNWSGSVIYNGLNAPNGTYALTGAFSGVLPDGALFTGNISQTVGEQKVQTYRLTSYIWVVKSGTGSYTVK
jgi:hypothetical protein